MLECSDTYPNAMRATLVRSSQALIVEMTQRCNPPVTIDVLPPTARHRAAPILLPGNGAGLVSSASLAFAIISSSDVTVPAGVPSRDTRAAPADNSRR
jgi:hypothetical protein